MANEWYTADNAHLLKSKKMATWRNGDAKLTSAGVHALDRFITGRLFEPVATTTPMATGASFLPEYRTTEYHPGTWEEILYLQTAMNLYPAMGVCSTTEATPNVHDITIRTGQTPVNMARHWERENITDAESERIDILGMMLNSLHMECSETSPVALQHNKWGVAFTKNSSTDDIATASLTDVPFKWSNFSGGFTFTYAGENLHDKMEITGWAFDIVNTLYFTGLDTNGRYSIGRYIPISYITTTLEIIPSNKNAFELIRDELPYSSDVDLTVKCSRNATTDYIQWTQEDLYCQPFIINAEKTPGRVEKYILVLSQMDTGSCVIQAKDAYNNDYYENP
jgi:hypothetical protein